MDKYMQLASWRWFLQDTAMFECIETEKPVLSVLSLGLQTQKLQTFIFGTLRDCLCSSQVDM